VTTIAPRTPVLIFGSHITALGVLRALARRGIDCYVVDDTTKIIVRSRWYRPTEHKLPESSDSNALDSFLRSLRLPRGVLIPCSDQWALAVAGLPDETRRRFPASISPRATVEQFVDKSRFSALVDRLDLPRPRSLLIREPADLARATDDELASAFLKPTDSHRHNRRFGTKGFFVSSRAEALQLVEEASADGITFILQEWIPGDESRTILIDGFVDRGGSIAAIGARRRLRMYPARLANTCSDVTIPLEDVQSCIAPLQALLAAVEYRGIFNVEFKYDDRDGRFKIIELNPRSFWLIGHIARAGLDLPWLTYLDAQDMALPSLPFEVGRYGLFEIVDAAAVLDALRRGRRPPGPVLGPWLRGDRALFWWTDPLPAIGALGQTVGWLVGRALRRSRRAEGDTPLPGST
jgi:predicted ATP-grasp superfamily ATP-dependent carboligase